MNTVKTMDTVKTEASIFMAMLASYNYEIPTREPEFSIYWKGCKRYMKASDEIEEQFYIQAYS